MQPQVSLQQKNTFGLPVSARHIVHAATGEELVTTWRKAEKEGLPFLLLGQGSNVLFLEDFAGYIALNEIKGIEITETDSDWLVHVGGGEVWHDLIVDLLEKNIAGLENLALIPGCTGSAPIQNIGAYGRELKDFCSYVELLDLRTGKLSRLEASECAFGYRESIFKHQYKSGYAITAVGLGLPKKWQPVLTYGELRSFDPDKVTAKAVFDAICQIRRSKLPDPSVTGNAGSFFKNPVVDAEKAQSLLAKYPDMPAYKQADGSLKLAAGWLIDQCGLKGHQIGGAAVHTQQALVIINLNNATPQDVANLARHVRQQVAERFGILLEPEVRFITAQGETDAQAFLS
ncbi:UDP-N-acetylmuramate dehydrogenase [Microvirga sp. W0021]|uniref:UDP-N-acetylenolpyruvoylglucosamine reductase n=1 Tax=Hohaiivirga grylli TaxID=3133970 RepID=A0ABV0BHK7_9HYPH